MVPEIRRDQMRGQRPRQTGAGMGIALGAGLGVCIGLVLGGNWLGICAVVGAGVGFVLGSRWDSAHDHLRRR